MSEQAVENMDLSNIRLGDDVLKIADGLAYGLAWLPGVEIPRPDPDMSEQEALAWRVETDPEIDEALGQTVKAYGPNMALRTNPEVKVHPGYVAGLLTASGLDKPMARSVHRPDAEVTGHEDALLATGNVAPWLEKVVDLCTAQAESGASTTKMYLEGGNRVMSVAADLRVKAVRDFMDNNGGRNPFEYEYLEQVIAPRLWGLGYDVEVGGHEDTDSAEEIVDRFAKNNPEVFLPGSQLVAVRAAGAALQLALDIRAAARKYYTEYDSDPNEPEIYALSNPLPTAVKRSQINDPDNYQSGFTGCRNVAVALRKYNQATEWGSKLAA